MHMTTATDHESYIESASAFTHRPTYMTRGIGGLRRSPSVGGGMRLGHGHSVEVLRVVAATSRRRHRRNVARRRRRVGRVCRVHWGRGHYCKRMGVRKDGQCHALAAQVLLHAAHLPAMGVEVLTHHRPGAWAAGSGHRAETPAWPGGLASPLFPVQPWPATEPAPAG